MKIALINGSPKQKNSASECILKALQTFIPEEHAITQFDFRNPQLSTREMELLAGHTAWVFAFPLYVDGIPSHLVGCLQQLEQYIKDKSGNGIMVYGLVNCGFYEGRHNMPAIQILRNWCKKSGLQWGQGTGIGAGGMLSMLNKVPLGHGPLKNVGKTIGLTSRHILNGTAGEDVFVTANFPRFAYKLAGEAGWRKQIKANGLRPKDLFIMK